MSEPLLSNAARIDPPMSDIWQRMSGWRLVLPPSRPSQAQIRFFAETLQKNPRDGPVAILGSTPEYRQLAHILGYQRTFIFEKNRAFYEQTTEELTSFGSEEVVMGDWRNTLSNFKQYFTVIFSDLTSGNIPYSDLENFYKDIACGLKPGGLFCDKILTFSTRLERIVDLHNKYCYLFPNLSVINYFSCEALFCSEVLGPDYILDTTVAYNKLEAFSTDSWWHELVARAKIVTPEDGMWYYGKPWDLLGPIYFRYLRLIDVKEDFPGSPYRGRAKLFISTQR